jgi:large subunit ribosomal protein L22
MQITAKLKNLRIASRKVRLISDLIKGLDAIAAKSQLDHLIKKSSKPISKLLDSALANAHNNFGLVKENLFIKDVIVDEGMRLKRFRPKGFGSTSPILKRTSCVKMILEEKVPGLKLTEQQIEEHKKAKETLPEKAEPTAKEEKAKTMAPKPEAKKEIGKKGLFGKMTKRFFRRKAI